MTTQIDLSTIEQGDTVVFRDGQKAIVNDIRERKSIVFDGVETTFHLVVYCTNDYSLIKNEFYPNGQSRWFDYQDIIQIIKNPKRWTDEDMKAAFDRGIDYATQEHDEVPHFRFWLRWYKQEPQCERAKK